MRSDASLHTGKKLRSKQPEEARSERQSRIDAQMQLIMEMVSANSQLVLVHSLIINSLSNQAIFLQLVHNTDDDSLLLLYIEDFKSYQVKEIRLNQITNPLWHMVYTRFGANNQILVMKARTFFSSYEFAHLMQLLVDEDRKSEIKVEDQ